jgi:hypothetical protein
MTEVKKGFALMTPETLKRIAAEGGRAAHRKGRAYEFTSEAARAAALKAHASRARNKTETPKEQP